MLNKKDFKVLLIEDDEEDFLLTKDLLSDITNRKYHLDWVPTYHRGLEEIRKRQHDVYLIDYRLGVDTGLDLIKQVFAEGYNLPMILLTGQGDQEIDEKAMEIGAADYLVKGGFDPYVLDRSIRYSILQFKILDEVRNLHEQSERRVQERTTELARTVEQLEMANHALLKHISERRHAEEALRESQNLLMTMAKNFPSGIISVLNQNLNFIFVEGMGLKTLGWTADKFLGKNLRDSFSTEQLKISEEPIATAFSGKHSTFEFEVKSRFFICYVVPLPNAGGHIKQVMLVSQDITERQLAEIEMRKALEKEKHLNELKSRFVSMASHEFRTPLATILSSVSLIARYNEPEDYDKRLKHINRIRGSVKNMTEILNEFLSLDKLGQGGITNQPVPFDLPAFCEDILDEMNVFVKEGQHIKIFYHGNFKPIVLDKQLLRNILINLISNAIKYSSENTQITIHVTLDKTKLNLSIADQGIGIPEEDQKHIFSTFFRAHNAINIQGTGLGLNIVKKYLDLMNGDISFTSAQNKGTIFTLSIPINYYYHDEKSIAY